MKKKIVGIFVCMLLIFTVFLPITGTIKIENTLRGSNKISSAESQDFIPGEFLIKFTEGTILSLTNNDNIIMTGIASIDSLNREFNVYNIEETFLSFFKNPKYPELFQSIGLDRIYTFRVNEEVNILNAVEAYKNLPCVEFVEPNGFGQGCIIPNDTNFNLQWGLHNTGQSGGNADADIDAPEAWDIETGDSNIVVAIVDSGIDYNHQDLSSRIWINSGEIPSNGLDDDNNGFIDDYRGWNFVHGTNDPMDDHTSSHGTHCAGITGAISNNNKGVAGVDWNCKLMAIKSMKSNNQISWTHGSLGIIYAADNGADVISMSWSGNDYNETLEDACNYAYSSGCVLFAAMGNHYSSTPHIPASYPWTIAVGATTDTDVRWWKSAYGYHCDVVAPGEDIYSTLKNNQFGYMSGTSMATPMVAGLAALLLAQDPTRTNAKIQEIIELTAEDQVGDPIEDTPGWDQYYGHGRVNAYEAVFNAPLKPAKPSGQINGKVGVEYTYSTNTWDPADDDVYYWFDWGDGTDSGWKGPYESGQTGSAKHKWSIEGNYGIKVKAKDENGAESEWSDTLSVTMPRNRAINMPFLNFLQNHPNLFPMFQRLLQVLGLQ